VCVFVNNLILSLLLNENEFEVEGRHCFSQQCLQLEDIDLCGFGGRGEAW
jgi:hypothetical protein